MQTSNPNHGYERGEIPSCRLHPTPEGVGFRLATAVIIFSNLLLTDTGQITSWTPAAHFYTDRFTRSSVGTFLESCLTSVVLIGLSDCG